MSDYFVPVFFHEQDINVSGVSAELGHAGWIQIKSDGTAKYYEYGRYDGTSGILRNPISTTVSFNLDGSPNIESILSQLGGRGKGDISASIFEVSNGSYDELDGIYSPIVDNNPDALGVWTPWNSCYGVMMQAGQEVGVNLNFIDGKATFTPAGAAAQIIAANGGVLYDVDESAFHYPAPTFLAGAFNFLAEYSNLPLLAMKALSPMMALIASLIADAVDEKSPLVFDLDDSGTIELTSLANTNTYWDIDNDGFAEKSGWVTGGDGLLALDINEDGVVTDHTELFGTASINGFAVLAQYDLNHDMVIDTNDAVYGDLLMWVDANENGYSESGELYSLSDLDIISINLAATEVSQTNQGHSVTHTSTFTVDTGSGLDNRAVHDVWFQYDNANTTYVEDYEIDPTALALPTLRGYGEIPDLHIAMSLDNDDQDPDSLISLVTAFAALDAEDIFTDTTAALDDVREIMFRWAGVDGVSSTSRGQYIDARELAFIEKLTGEPFLQQGYASDPGFWAADKISNAFDIALNNIFARLVVQSAGADLFEGDLYYNVATDSVDGVTGLNLTTLDALETTATGLSTTNDRIAFWDNVVRTIEFAFGTANLDVGDAAALDDAIIDSDMTLDLDDILLSLEWTSPGGSTTNGTSGVDTINAGSGNDEIYAKESGDAVNGGDGQDIIYGEAGNDTLDGQAGADIIYGGGGDDTYKYTAGQGIDVFQDYSTGTDRILFASGISISDLTITRASNSDLVIDIAAGVGGGRIIVDNHFNAAVNVAGAIETLEFAGGGSAYTLTDKSYTLNGTAENDTLYGVSTGGASTDTIYGLGGDDIIYTYAPNQSDTAANSAYGGDGNDSIYSKTGADTLSGGAGDDYINDTGGNDTIHYESGNDRILNNGGSADVLQLANGIVSGDVSYYRMGASDLVILVDGFGSITIQNQYLSGNAYQIETLRFYDTSTVTLSGVAYTAIYGNSSAETLTGTNSYNDLIYGYGGNDSIFGRSGNDTIYAGDGTDSVDGEGGDDVIYGGTGVDTLEGGANNDTIYGEDGNDSLYGDGGNDTITGGTGNDYMHDSSGNEIYIYEGGLDDIEDLAGTDVLRLTGSTTINDLSFTDLGYDHRMVIDSGVNEIDLMWWDWSAGYKIETIEFADGFTTSLSNYTSWIKGTSGNDIVSGGASNETLIGYAGNDSMDGGGGIDAIHGGAGADTIEGGSGNDLLHGGADNDILYGEDGLDSMYGGAGNDTFVFQAASAFNNVDVVKDFDVDDDAIDIADVLDTYFTPGVDDITQFVRITDNGTDSTLEIDQNGGGNSFVTVAAILGVTGLTNEAALVTGGALIVA